MNDEDRVRFFNVSQGELSSTYRQWAIKHQRLANEHQAKADKYRRLARIVDEKDRRQWGI